MLRNTGGQSAGWLALLAGAVIAAGVVVIWFVIDQRAHEHANLATEHTADVTQLLIRQDVENRFTALDRLAQRWSASKITHEVWLADARRYLADMPGFLTIEHADESMQEIWVASVVPGRPSPGQGAAAAEQLAISVNAARESGVAAVSAPFEIPQAGLAIAVTYPTFREQQVDGRITGVLQLEPWLDAVVGGVQNADHHVRVSLRGQKVYEHAAFDDVHDTSSTVHSEFEVRGLSWNIEITPTGSFLSAGHADSSSLVLVAGLLVSLLVAVVVYLALISRAQSHAFHDTATQLATLLKNLPGVAYRRANEPGWPMLFVSDGCGALTGYSKHEIGTSHKPWQELTHPDDRENVPRQIQQAIDADESFELEYRIINKSGDEHWVWERGRAVKSEADSEIHIEGFVSDITDRKFAETELIEARAFSDAVLDTAADAVITFDANGTIEIFNRAAQEMFGYSLAEARGENVDILMSESYRPKHGNYVSTYLESGETHVIGVGREVMARRKDGGLFPIHLSVSEVHDRPERKFVGLIRDLSSQRAAENEAREHRGHLAHLDRLNMLGEMASGIAHEINQPLTAISLFSQAGIRLADADKRDQIPEIFEKLVEHANRASAVIERMQTMTRQHDSLKEVVECDVLVEGVARLAEAEARIRDMTIEVDSEDNLPNVSVDAVQIQQVALNLLRNGMESMQSVDSRHGNTIGLRSRLLDDGEIEISVIDRGTGVSEEVARTLFAPFSTTKKSGMGMGLSISRAITIAHGGHLDFRNNNLGGATFFFTLPPAGEESLND